MPKDFARPESSVRKRNRDKFSVNKQIISPIVASDLVTLAGNVHRLATPEFDRGILSGETRLERMALLFEPEADHQKAPDPPTGAPKEPGSAHQGLSPADYGSRLGASAAGLAKVTAWLPAGVSASWSADPLTPGSSAGQASATVTLKSATTAPLASATAVITAGGGGVSVTKSMTTQVTNEPAAPVS